MTAPDALARATLDTLPLNLAVVDPAGDIVFTNRAWRTFERDGEVQVIPEQEGVNYLDAIDRDDDEYAAAAAEGLREVIDGERDLFTLEYPCHSPDARRWFLMRAAAFEFEGAPHVAVAHVDITERRLAEEAVERERAALDHLVERVNGLLAEVTDVLVGAGTRGAIERGVCERLAATDPYVGARFYRLDLVGESLTERAAAGESLPDPGALSLLAGRETDGGREFGDAEFGGADGARSERQGDTDPGTVPDRDPAAVAVAADEVRLHRDLPAGPRWADAAREADVDALAALPITYRDARHGVLVVYARGERVFEEREAVVLEAIAQAIASAIHAAEGTRVLATTGVVELAAAIDDPDEPLCALSDRTGAELAYRGSVPGPDGTTYVFVEAREAPEGSLLAATEWLESVARIDRVGDGALYELQLADPLVDRLAAQGAVVREWTVADGTATVELDVPDEATARATFAWLEDAFAGVELVAYRDAERRARTPDELSRDLTAELTDRQATALRLSHLGGYFEWPRAVDGEALADRMDVSRPTFHQHLRAAERKVLDAVFDGE